MGLICARWNSDLWNGQVQKFRNQFEAFWDRATGYRDSDIYQTCSFQPFIGCLLVIL